MDINRKLFRLRWGEFIENHIGNIVGHPKVLCSPHPDTSIGDLVDHYIGFYQEYEAREIIILHKAGGIEQKKRIKDI